MRAGAPASFGAQLRALREGAGFTQEELATIAGLSVHAVSALERGERRRPHVETVRALSAAFDLTGVARDALFASARASARDGAVDELTRVALPLPPTAILGRENDVELLRRWLADPAARLITLVGPGGVGKTRLALELARTIDDEGGTRVVFVPLAAVSASDLVALAIAEALGLAEVTAAELPVRVKAAYGRHPTLLVLDNCEHVLDATPLIAALRVRGERQYSVGPLAIHLESETVSIADRARVPAVRLFVERARDVQREFRLSTDNGPAVTAICQRLDGLPLALELAAPWIKVLTAADLLNRLAQDPLLSTAGPRDLPTRQQTITATVAWSYHLLDRAGMHAFRRFGALPVRFSIGAAAAVLGGRERRATREEALDAAASFIDKSLLQRTEGAGTNHSLYQMLETVRAYARLELSSAGEQDDALEGLVGYCLKEVAEASNGLASSAQAEWLNRMRDDLESYREALAWLIERNRNENASDVAWGLGLFFLVRGHTSEGLHWYERILKLPALAPLAEAKARIGAGLMLWAQGALDAGRAHATRSLEISRGAGAIDLAVHAEGLLGHIEHAAGNLEDARERYVRSLEGYRMLAVPWGIGNSLSGLAGVTLTAGDPLRAEPLLADAEAALRDCGPWFLLPVRCFRAILAVQSGQHDLTISLIRESLTHIRALQDKFAFVYALVPLAAAAVLKDNHAWAARLLGARDAVAESTGATIVDNAVHAVRMKVEQDARERLGPAGWARAYAAGRTASIDSLLSDELQPS